MANIIGMSGRKQSGKNTAANYLSGSILKSKGMVQDFQIDSEGNLLIKTTDRNQNVGWGVFDLTRKDFQFTSYAEKEIWPYVKIYHFADYLKKISIELFDLTPQQVYGTDEDKNTETPYGMTSREFLQYLGTDVMRKIKDTVWVDSTLNTIKKENTEVAIIPDVRFPNEVKAIHQAGGIVVRLTRDPHESEHGCETALDADKFNWDEFDYVVDNSNSDIDKLIVDMQQLQKKWGVEC